MEIINLKKQFEIYKNIDAKRWEFNSLNNKSVSYIISFNDADNETDALIAIWKAIERNI